MQEPLAQISDVTKTASVEMGWSGNVVKMQIESNLYERQIKSNKVSNFTATLPAPQSELVMSLSKVAWTKMQKICLVNHLFLNFVRYKTLLGENLQF